MGRNSAISCAAPFKPRGLDFDATCQQLERFPKTAQKHFGTKFRMLRLFRKHDKSMTILF